MKKVIIHKDIVWVCLVTAIIISFLSILLPPRGEIDASVLMFIAQLLVFSASVLFNSATVIKQLNALKKLK